MWRSGPDAAQSGFSTWTRSHELEVVAVAGLPDGQDRLALVFRPLGQQSGLADRREFAALRPLPPVHADVQDLPHDRSRRGHLRADAGRHRHRRQPFLTTCRAYRISVSQPNST